VIQHALVTAWTCYFWKKNLADFPHLHLWPYQAQSKQMPLSIKHIFDGVARLQENGGACNVPDSGSSLDIFSYWLMIRNDGLT
jgi:hypothetical protein